MKIIRYAENGEPRFGIVEGDTVYQGEGDLFSGLTKGAKVGTVESLTVLPPVSPSKVVAVGLNYALHVTENDPTRQIPTEPVIFMKPPSAIIGHGDVIMMPDAPRIDYEAELCIVIGKKASRVSEADALDYVLGYTCANDVSARDWQAEWGGSQWCRGKTFDTFCPLGPCLVTTDEITNPNELAIKTVFNGEALQDWTTSDMIFDVATLIAFCSEHMTLEVGDVISTGTPAGVGNLSPGDVVEVEIEGIGVLENPVVARATSAR